MWEFLGEHPVAAFFLILAIGWAIAAPIEAWRGRKDDE